MPLDMAKVGGFLANVADGTEAVTVTLARTSGDVAVSVDNALRQPVTRKFQMAGGVNLESADTVFNIPDSQLNPAANGRVIQPQDTIAGGGVTWIVQHAQLATLGSRWECVCARKR